MLYVAGLLLVACTAPAPPPQADQAALVIDSAIVRRLAARGSTIAAYLTIRNQSTTADTLLTVTSPEAAVVSIHHTEMHGDHAMMVSAPQLPLPPSATVTMQPGGTHLMLESLTAPLPVGDSVTLHLTFRHAAAQSLRLPILGLPDEQ